MYYPVIGFKAVHIFLYFSKNGKKKPTTAVIERYSIYVFFLLSYETNLE